MREGARRELGGRGAGVDNRACVPEPSDERMIRGCAPLSPRRVALAVTLAGKEVLLLRRDRDPEERRRRIAAAAEPSEDLLRLERTCHCRLWEDLGQRVDAALVIPVVLLNL